MEIEKAYFTLPEILDRWSLPEADLIYLAENDKLRLSVRVFGLPLEFGDHETTDDGRRYSVPLERKYFSGLMDLNARDAFRLFRCGELVVTEFRTPKADYASLWDDAEPVLFNVGDLLLRREKRDRFEAKSGFSGARTEASQPTFLASPDYYNVRCQGREFRLGPIQAQVVRVLHDAARAGNPWLSGKAILAAAGSRSLKMSDVFKSQEHWRDLIASNQRGSTAWQASDRSVFWPGFDLSAGWDGGWGGGPLWDGDPPPGISPLFRKPDLIPLRIPLRS